MTEFDTPNNDDPTAPFSASDSSTAPTQPLPGFERGVSAEPHPLGEGASGPSAGISPSTGQDNRAWRPSTGGLVAIAAAGALMLSMVSFGAGWGAHGLASHLRGVRGPGMVQTRSFEGRQGFGLGTPGAGRCPMGGDYGRGGEYGTQDGGRGWGRDERGYQRNGVPNGGQTVPQQDQQGGASFPGWTQ